ncbi:MAG: AAA family ATPase [Candidatus Rokubacteria bacterium]|nr:AAA family ATPase [Candidatus Rokubacteria bacterium]
MAAVTCGSCRHENRAGAKFCEACGAKLERRCPACGQPARDGARFCDECGQALDRALATPAPAAGTPVPVAMVSDVADRLARRLGGYTPRHLAEKILTSRAALEGERKLVTVLFADCAGFTELSTRLDPEDLHGVMDGCFQHLAEAVHRYEGTVNQFTGDGVMALFGAPIAHEDHAVRAVAAALMIQQAARGYGETLRRERGLGFAMRIGLNTGPVVVGRIGDDLRMDYTAQGETVNLAARLQTAAEPGGVLISDATHRLVSGYFVTEELPPLVLKGFGAPVRAFVVRGRRRRARFQVSLERGITPFVARDRELAFVCDGLERARSGRAQVLSVVGEAGVGKSRLAWELRRAIGDADVTWLEAQCPPHSDALPFAVVGQLLRANFGMDEGEPEAAQMKKIEAGVTAIDPAIEWTIPYLKHLLALPAPVLEAEGLDQAQRRRRMIEAVKAIVLAGAARRPLVLTVEDLQWIDRNSEDLFAAIIDALAGHRVMILTTYRPGYVPPWHDRAYHQRLTVDALGDEETLAMLAALLGGTPSPGMRRLIAERAGGNPLFVEELIRYLRERDVDLEGDPAALAGAEVPASIHDVLTSRIDRLPESLKRTLQLASVLGAEFSLRLLETISPRDADLLADLGELVRMQLLRERETFPEARYAFTHLLVRQVAYEALLFRARAELHGRAAAALERLYADRVDEVLRELADHYAKSPDRAKALHYLVRAGDRAASLFAYEDASGYYRRALEMLDQQPDGTVERAAILDRLGDAAFAHGAVGEARARWLETLGLVRDGGDHRRVADLHRRIGVAAWTAGDRDDALVHLERGLDALGEDADNREAARLHQELARIHVRLGNHERAMDLAEQALTLAERLGAAEVVADAYNTWGVAVARAGDLEGGAAYVTRSLDTALAHGLGTVACRAYVNLAVMYGPLDRERALGSARDGLALAQRIGDQLQQSWLYCAVASGHCSITGDYDEGVRAAEAAIELDRRLGQRSHLPVPLIILAQVYQCRGEGERSEGYYKEALALAETIGDPQLLVPCYDGLATLAIERGDDTQADEWLGRCRQVQDATGWTSETFLVLPFLC